LGENRSTSNGPRWHTLTLEATYARLGVSARGLTTDEARRRLESHGPNALRESDGISPWAILLGQFQNVLVIILLIATGISIVLGHGVESAAIAVIVLLAVLLGFVQEFRAERAMEALRGLAAPSATALRDEQEREIPARELVPGDVILIHAGDRIPADVRLMESASLQVEEAPLTGESVPVEKSIEPLGDAERALGDRVNMAYAGTAATKGRGKAVVVATGMETEFGRIADLLQTVEKTATPLQRNLDRLGKTLAKFAIAIVAMIVAGGLWRGQDPVEMLIFGIALAVAVVPEALPAVVTISLAIGVQRMVKRNALVRRLPAVETLGGTSVICSDKTGTLTKDEMTCRRIHVGGASVDVTGAGYEPKGEFLAADRPIAPDGPLRALLEGALLASDARIVFREDERRWMVKGDPTEGALVVLAAKAGIDRAELEARRPRVDEIPFTSETKRMTTIHSDADGRVAFSKGAPEVVIGSCSDVLDADGVRPLDAARRADWLAAATAMAESALRVLAIARRVGADRSTAESDMTLLGLVGMIDPPRPEARAAIETCREAGIRPIMITGDHPVTARAIAREMGILTGGHAITGAELDAVSDAELSRRIDALEVFARVSPAHKLRIVATLQGKGHVVAMTGDGVNDAPALKKADIGVAMGITGTDVSKEAADMTLTDDNFASIVAAVEEGRAIFGNIKKYLMYLLSSNIGEIGLMAGASVLGWPLPLTAIQILYVNLATDGLPALALAVDPPEADLMRRPPRNPRDGIFTRPVILLMLAGGVWSSLTTAVHFGWQLGTGRDLAEAQAMTFVTLVLIEFVKAYAFRSDRHSALVRPFANRWLNRAIGLELILLIPILHVPFLQRVFGTFALAPRDWLHAILGALTVLPALELVKRVMKAEGGTQVVRRKP